MSTEAYLVIVALSDEEAVLVADDADGCHGVKESQDCQDGGGDGPHHEHRVVRVLPLAQVDGGSKQPLKDVHLAVSLVGMAFF